MDTILKRLAILLLWAAPAMAQCNLILLHVGGCPTGVSISPTIVQWNAVPSTYSSTGHTTSTGGATSIRIPLQPTLSGNTIVICAAGSHISINTITVTGTDSASNTYSTAQDELDTMDNNALWCRYVKNVAAGVTYAEADFSVGVTNVSGIAWEQAGTNGVDKTSAARSTTATIQPGNIGAMSQSGDLIIQIAQNVSAATVTAFTAGTGQSNITWTKIASDTAIPRSSIENALAMQAGVYSATAAFNPKMTQTGSTGAATTVAIAFTPSTSQGTLPAAGERVVGMQDLLFNFSSTSPGTLTQDLPCPGSNAVTSQANGMIMAYTGLGTELSTITDSNSNSWVLKNGLSQNGNQTQFAYAQNATCTSEMTVSVTFSGPPLTGDDNLRFFFVTGAPTSGWFDVVNPSGAGPTCTGTCTGDQTTSGNTTGPSITPSNATGLIIGEQVQDCDVVTSGTSGDFLAMTWGNTPYACTDTQHINDDNGSGYALIYNTSTSSQNFVWQYLQPIAPDNWSGAIIHFN